MVQFIPDIMPHRSWLWHYTAEHTINSFVRITDIELASLITNEKNVWIRGHVTLVAGVTIGEGSIIGAGSVVKKDIPKNVIAVAILVELSDR